MNLKKIILFVISLIAPILFIIGPVFSKAGIELEFLELLSNKMSYFIITLSNAVALIIAIRDKNYQLSVIFALWVFAMGSMFFLH